MLVLMLPRVSSRVSGFPVAAPCLCGKLQNLSFLKLSKQVVMSSCVAGMALCEIPTCLITSRKSFCVAGAILLRRFQEMRCIFRGRRNTLETIIVILHGRRSTWGVWCCVFFANLIVRAASSGDKVQIPWQVWHFVRSLENWRTWKLTEASQETSIFR